tara:strand:- start:453 stop:881 length:429 start_codon:yes stop_codon:yes gene_type:complete
MKKILILFFLLSACNPRGEGDSLSLLINILGFAFVAVILWISGTIIDFFTNPKDKNYQNKPSINKNKETGYLEKNRKNFLDELAEDKKRGDALEDGYTFNSDNNNIDKNAETEHARINREKFLKELADDKRKGDKAFKEKNK